jgi:GMP synthase (glutamine-hydrolysing)
MPGDVLIVVHQEHSTPGRVGEMLIEAGCALERRCPNCGDPLPDPSLNDYRAAFVFGGPMSANDDREMPGIGAELRWLERAVGSGTPLVGICLGAQLIARALGARVGRHPDGLVEMGYYDIVPTMAGQAYFPRPATFYQWHSETFELPAGAVQLARSNAFEQQAFRFDQSVYGLEFHPEMTRAMVERWSAPDNGGPKLVMPNARPREAHLDGFERHAPGSDDWLRWFLRERILRLPQEANATAAD